MNLSFAGCGFLGIYHVGVAVCFRKYAPHLLLNKISGASAGAIAACCLLCDLPLGDITSDVLRVCTEARSRSLGPFSPSFNVQNVLLEGLERFLPEDAHIRVSGRLHVSLTRVYDGKNVIISHFDSKEDLLQVLMASAFVPIFSGIIPPRFKGVRYMDGGFSDNLPTLDENTITVSPFCGESDICPRDESSQLFHINIANTSIEVSKQNIYRFTRILFPPKPEILSNMCKQGFDDALRFLHRNNLINCTRCLAVQSTFVVSESLDESFEYDPECHECKIHRQEALVSNMPETVLSIFQDAIDSANKGLINWVFKHRGMKLLSILSLPYTLPADIMYATITKIAGCTLETYTYKFLDYSNHVRCHYYYNKHFTNRKRLMAAAPTLGDGLWDASKLVMDQLTTILNKMNSKRQQFSAKILCQLAITEYGGDKFDVESCQDLPLAARNNKMNLNFTLNLDDSDLPINQSPRRKFNTNKILSRRSSLSINCTDAPVDDDTFEHILQVTAQHEAIMAYYYMDENNKVKVTEIFDVTDSDSVAVQTPSERQFNSRLEYESDWESHMEDDQIYLDDQSSAEEMSSEYSQEDLLERDANTIFSDPESEWNASTTKQEQRVDLLLERSRDLRPESDQPPSLPEDVYRPFKIRASNLQNIDI